MRAPWWWSKTETCRSDIYVDFNVNFNVFFKLIKVYLLVSELYIYQTVRCKDKNSPYYLFLLKFPYTFRYRLELDKKISNNLYKHVYLWLVFASGINNVFSEVRCEAEERVDHRTSSLVKLKAEYGRWREVDYQSLAEVMSLITFWVKILRM